MFQMVYASAATRALAEEELAEILSAARVNNNNLGVGGLLLYENGSFIQALEGPQSTVDALFEKISVDPRHTDCQVLFRGEVEDASFQDWSMGFVNVRSRTAVPEGYHDFLRRGFRRNLDNEGDMARRALLAFRDGRWRRVVEHDDSHAA